MNLCLATFIFLFASSVPSSVKDCEKDPSIHHDFSVRHSETSRKISQQGYSTLDYLLTQSFHRHLLFLNLRGHVFNNLDVGGNSGFGIRVPLRQNNALGANIFYDFRRTQKHLYNQMGFGLEYFHEKFDFRFNNYIPFGKGSSWSTKKQYQLPADFIKIRKNIYASLPCSQAEIGVNIGKILYISAGPYYLFQRTLGNIRFGNKIGGYFRSSLDFGSNISFTTIVTYDPIFKGNVQGSLEYKISIGKEGKTEKKRDLLSRPIYRRDLICIQSKMIDSVINVETTERSEKVPSSDIFIPKEIHQVTTPVEVPPMEERYVEEKKEDAPKEVQETPVAQKEKKKSWFLANWFGYSDEPVMEEHPAEKSESDLNVIDDTFSFWDFDDSLLNHDPVDQNVDHGANTESLSSFDDMPGIEFDTYEDAVDNHPDVAPNSSQDLGSCSDIVSNFDEPSPIPDVGSLPTIPQDLNEGSPNNSFDIKSWEEVTDPAIYSSDSESEKG